MAKNSKINNVAEHLKRHGTVNGKQIVWDYHLTYPSCVIRSLKNKGMDIESVPVEGKNYVEYKLAKVFKVKF